MRKIGLHKASQEVYVLSHNPLCNSLKSQTLPLLLVLEIDWWKKLQGATETHPWVSFNTGHHLWPYYPPWRGEETSLDCCSYLTATLYWLSGFAAIQKNFKYYFFSFSKHLIGFKKKKGGKKKKYEMSVFYFQSKTLTLQLMCICWPSWKH